MGDFEGIMGLYGDIWGHMGPWGLGTYGAMGQTDVGPWGCGAMGTRGCGAQGSVRSVRLSPMSICPHR